MATIVLNEDVIEKLQQSLGEPVEVRDEAGKLHCTITPVAVMTKDDMILLATDEDLCRRATWSKKNRTMDQALKDLGIS